MTKTQRMIDAVTKTPGLTFGEYAEKVDMTKGKARALLHSLKHAKRITSAHDESGKGELHYYPIKSKTPAPRTFHDVARNFRKPVVVIPSLAQRHVGTTLAALQAVIDLDKANPTLAAVFRSHQEAIELMQVAT